MTSKSLSRVAVAKWSEPWKNLTFSTLLSVTLTRSTALLRPMVASFLGEAQERVVAVEEPEPEPEPEVLQGPPGSTPPVYSQCQGSLGTVRTKPNLVPFLASQLEVVMSRAMPLWWLLKPGLAARLPLLHFLLR